MGSVSTDFALFLFPLFSVLFFFLVYQKKKKVDFEMTESQKNLFEHRHFRME